MFKHIADDLKPNEAIPGACGVAGAVIEKLTEVSSQEL